MMNYKKTKKEETDTTRKLLRSFGDGEKIRIKAVLERERLKRLVRK